MLIPGQPTAQILALSFQNLCCLGDTAGKPMSLGCGAVDREAQQVRAG